MGGRQRLDRRVGADTDQLLVFSDGGPIINFLKPPPPIFLNGRELWQVLPGQKRPAVRSDHTYRLMLTVSGKATFCAEWLAAQAIGTKVAEASG